MPPVVIPNCLQVITSGTILGQPWTSVFHVNGSATGAPLDDAAAGDIAVAFGAYYTALEPGRTEEWNCNMVRVVDIRTADGRSVEFPITRVGSGTGEPVPPNLAIVTSLRTLKRGPRYRGRTFNCGFTEDQMENGRLDSVAQDAEEVAAQGLLDDLEALNNNLVVASRKYLTFEEITSFAVNNVFDGQVRRRFPQ